jgi:protein phosphatase
MLFEGRTEQKEALTVDSTEWQVPAAVTDTGCERELNEDRYAVIESQSGTAWLVCDGMGGVAGGELAAQLAIDGIRRDLQNLPARLPETALKSALLEANRIIVLRRQNQAFAAMGTTVVAGLFQERELAIAHVGDSRAYLVRDGAIQQLTTDHTYVQELVERNEIKAVDALAHPQAHILTRAIGAEPGLQIDIQKLWIAPAPEDDVHDILVLCTDGLYTLVSDGEIADAVTRQSPRDACVHLVETAKSRGGFDNITVAIVPLEGQLRREAPAGYKRPVHKQMKVKNKLPDLSVAGKTLLITVLLSAVGSMLTALVMAFNLVR